MAKLPVHIAFVSSLAVWLGSVALVGANPQVDAILKFHPRQSGVAITTPTAEEVATCTVQVVTGKAGSSGYLLADAKGKTLRRFLDSNGDKKVDVWAYFKDGEEVYREIDTNGNNMPDQFRWVGRGGLKWGIDANEDGKIESWRMISVEEAAEEALKALATSDFERLKSLFITEAEMRSLKLPAERITELLQRQSQAAAKFQATIAKIPHLAKAEFERVEGEAPCCLLAETSGTEQDVISFRERNILYQYSEGSDSKHDWLETGELIQVGYALRLTDVPGVHSLEPLST